MVQTKTWLAIPILAIACAGLALLAGTEPSVAVAVAALGAALATAVRALAGPSLAVALAAAAASLVGVLGLLDLAAIDLARAALADAAALFAIGEIIRPLPPDASPWPALGAAAVAAVLDPSFVLLLPISGIRLARGPWSLPRWTVAAPIVGVLVVALAVLATVFRHGALHDLWTLWAARSGAAHTPLETLTETGDLLGPVTSVVALAGLAICALRGRLALAAIVGSFAGAMAIDLVAGSTGAATVACAAIGAGAGITRFSALIRWPVGQAFLGATVGAMLVVAPVWTLAMR